jgi:hypothetical protein
MFNARCATDPLRVALSLIAGAAAYAILMVPWGFWGHLESFGIQFVLDYGLRQYPFVFAFSFLGWGVFLVVFYLPLWLLFHKLRLRHWLVAVSLEGQ